MGYKIRLANIDSDRDAIFATLHRPSSDSSMRFEDRTARFDYIYRNNPDGPGLMWIAQDDHGDVIGTSGAVPRQMYVGETLRTGVVLTDFWIRPDYRLLGPAIKLQKACLEYIDSGQTEFCIDMSGSDMNTIWKRLGIKPLDQLARFSKPLRLDWYLERRFGSKLLSRCLSPVANLLLQARDAPIKPSGTLEVSILEQPCGDEFTQLADRLGPEYGLCVRRTAEYLNWSYREHCYYSHQILTARRNGQLVGYCVLLVNDNEAAHVIDLFAEDDVQVVQGLLAKLMKILRSGGSAMSIWLWMLESSNYRQMPQTVGYKYREQPRSLIVYANDKELASTLRGPYHFMLGDLPDVWYGAP
ncbi:MAG: hypothetical protein ACR2QQ_12005 [Gammaproteobacteria bacterium]